MPSKIINMSIEEISPVDKPANNKPFLIIKREINKGGEIEMSREELLKKLDDEVKTALENEFAKMQEEIDKLSEEDDDKDKLDKSALPADVRKRIEDAEKRIEKAEKIAKKEREARLEIEFKKTANQYKDLAEVDKFVSLLKKVDEDLREDLIEIFDEISKRVETSDLFKQAGNDDVNDSDAETVLDKKVEALLEKNTDLTKEKALVKVLERNPELYNDYLNQ